MLPGLNGMMEGTSGYTYGITPVSNSFDAVDRTTYTFSGLVLGDDAPDRYIAVAIAARNNGSSSSTFITSVTVAGISATKCVQNVNGSGDKSRAEIWIAAVPSGATGNVVVTFPVQQARCHVSLFRMTGLNSSTPTATQVSDSSPATLNVNVAAPWVGVAASYAENGFSLATSWSGITQYVDNYNSSENANYSSAYGTGTSAESPRAIGISWTGTATDPASCIAVWS